MPVKARMWQMCDRYPINPYQLSLYAGSSPAFGTTYFFNNFNRLFYLQILIYVWQIKLTSQCSSFKLPLPNLDNLHQHLPDFRINPMLLFFFRLYLTQRHLVCLVHWGGIHNLLVGNYSLFSIVFVVQKSHTSFQDGFARHY